MTKYFPPKLDESSFTCPHCGVYSEQIWSNIISCSYFGASRNTPYSLNGTMISKCTHCNQISIWIEKKMVYPLTGNVEMGNNDLPEDIKKDYNEAKDIVNISPRGAAALLRLAVQKLCVHLGEKGMNLNEDIKNLVNRGLPKSMQQALDSVRVIGNNAVHPGSIDFNDNINIAYSLFGFINIICEILISQPKKINEYYEKNVPERAKDAIDKRDKKS